MLAINFFYSKMDQSPKNVLQDSMKVMIVGKMALAETLSEWLLNIKRNIRRIKHISLIGKRQRISV